MVINYPHIVVTQRTGIELNVGIINSKLIGKSVGRWIDAASFCMDVTSGWPLLCGWESKACSVIVSRFGALFLAAIEMKQLLVGLI